jgi:hypothetical protein
MLLTYVIKKSNQKDILQLGQSLLAATSTKTLEQENRLPTMDQRDEEDLEYRYTYSSYYDTPTYPGIICLHINDMYVWCFA